MASCQFWAVWFHYEDGSTQGVWVLRFRSSANPISDCTQITGLDPTVDCFTLGVNPEATQIIFNICDGLNQGDPPVQLAEIANALYTAGATDAGDGLGIADDYAITCGDAPSGDSVIPTCGARDLGCGVGYYYDVPSETCKPICGSNPAFCLPPVVTPPPKPGNPPSLPPPGSCKPPGFIALVGGNYVCMFDPPTPNPLPNPLPFTAVKANSRPKNPASSVPQYGLAAVNAGIAYRESSQISSAKAEYSATFKALNPTVKPGLPKVFKYCGCNDPIDEHEEELIG